MREAFALQKRLTFFQQKILAYIYEILMFEILTSLVLNNRALNEKVSLSGGGGVMFPCSLKIIDSVF